MNDDEWIEKAKTPGYALREINPMKPATVLYSQMIEFLRERAKELGYAIAVHGSLARDIDLIACPWSEGAVDAATLAEAVRVKCENCTGEKWYIRHDDPGKKPHGRLCWTIFPSFGGGCFVDLSVMPLRAAGGGGGR